MATEIKTGRYVITNVQQKTVANLPDANDGTPGQSGVSDFETTAQVSTGASTMVYGSPAHFYSYSQQWNVSLLGNGKHEIKSVGSANYANAGNRPPEGAKVEGRSAAEQWTIQETRVQGQYT